MMALHFRSVGLSLVICLGLALSIACGDPQTTLLGTWQSTTAGGGTIEFFKDGTVNVTGSTLGLLIATAGKYKVLEHDRLSLEFSGVFGLGGASVYRFGVSANELTLTGSSGNGQKFRKA